MAKKTKEFKNEVSIIATVNKVLHSTDKVSVLSLSIPYLTPNNKEVKAFVVAKYFGDDEFNEGDEIKGICHLASESYGKGKDKKLTSYLVIDDYE